MQAHGGTVHEKKGLLPTPLPQWLARLARRLAADTAAYGVDADGRPKEPNHVLVNAYTAEQGIMVHTAAMASTTVTSAPAHGAYCRICKHFHGSKFHRKYV